MYLATSREDIRRLNLPSHPPNQSLNPFEETILQPVLKSSISVFIQNNEGLENKLTRVPPLGLPKPIYYQKLLSPKFPIFNGLEFIVSVFLILKFFSSQKEMEYLSSFRLFQKNTFRFFCYTVQIWQIQRTKEPHTSSYVSKYFVELFRLHTRRRADYIHDGMPIYTDDRVTMNCGTKTLSHP